MGIPPTITPEPTILEAISKNGVGLPEVFRILLVVTYKASICSDMLPQVGYRGTSSIYEISSVMKLFDDEIDILQATNSGSCPLLCRIAMLGKRILLYSLGLQVSSPREKGKASALSLESSLCAHQAFASAMSLVGAATSEPEEYSRWTFIENYCLMVSAMVLIKILKKTQTENAGASQALADSWRILRYRSRFDKDFHASMCDLIEYISKYENQLDEGESDDDAAGTHINSRGALSLAIETLRQARRRYVRDTTQASQHSPESYGESSNMSMDMDDSLFFGMGMDPGLDLFWDDWPIALPDLSSAFPQTMP